MKYVIYHHKDADGYVSGYLILKYLTEIKNVNRENIKIIPINYNTTYKIVKGDIIYIVDFFDKLLIDLLIKEGNNPQNIYVYDHHDSTPEEYKSINISLEKNSRISACLHIYFKLIQGTKIDTEKINLLANAVSVWDTWNKDHPNISFYEYAYPLRLYIERMVPTADLPDTLLDDFEKHKHIILYFEKGLIHKIAKNFMKVKLIHKNKVYKAIACNTHERSTLIYELAVKDGAIKPTNPQIIILFNRINKTDMAVSLYSLDSSINVMKIAKNYYGGGHKMAAGFTCNDVTIDGDYIFFT